MRGGSSDGEKQGSKDEEAVMGRNKGARRRKRRGGRTALNPEVVAVAAEALVEASELGTAWAQFCPEQQFCQNRI